MDQSKIRQVAHLYFALILWALLFASGCLNATQATPTQPATVASAAPSSTPSSRSETQRGSGPGFASRKKWLDHFAKHGREFGDVDAEGYLRMAQELRDRPLSSDILESQRDNGEFARFERSSGSFLACNRDRTIRTFFRPRDGERYFQRQARRHR